MGTNKVFGPLENVLLQSIFQKRVQGIGKKLCCRFGEIDIIAAHRNNCFYWRLDKKQRKFGMPSEAVSLTKQNRMVKLLYYMQKNKLLDYMCRFDVLEIIVDEDNIKRINLIKDAFNIQGSTDIRDERIFMLLSNSLAISHEIIKGLSNRATQLWMQPWEMGMTHCYLQDLWGKKERYILSTYRKQL